MITLATIYKFKALSGLYMNIDVGVENFLPDTTKWAKTMRY